jgi:hypothetical protein
VLSTVNLPTSSSSKLGIGAPISNVSRNRVPAIPALISAITSPRASSQLLLASEVYEELEGRRNLDGVDIVCSRCGTCSESEEGWLSISVFEKEYDWARRGIVYVGLFNIGHKGPLPKWGSVFCIRARVQLSHKGSPTTVFALVYIETRPTFHSALPVAYVQACLTDPYARSRLTAGEIAESIPPALYQGGCPLLYRPIPNSKYCRHTRDVSRSEFDRQPRTPGDAKTIFVVARRGQANE